MYSTYGPSADTGGLFQQKAPTLYVYAGEAELLEGEGAGGWKALLPDPGSSAFTERPG